MGGQKDFVGTFSNTGGPVKHISGKYAKKPNYSYSYDSNNLVKLSDRQHYYYEVHITVYDGPLDSTHVFYISKDGDTMVFSNIINETAFATRSTSLVEGMLAAFREIKGYGLSGRTVEGVHSEIIFHEFAYRLGIGTASSKEADIGTLKIPLFVNGNDGNAVVFEKILDDWGPAAGFAMRASDRMSTPDSGYDWQKSPFFNKTTGNW